MWHSFSFAALFTDWMRFSAWSKFNIKKETSNTMGSSSQGNLSGVQKEKKKCVLSAIFLLQ